MESSREMDDSHQNLQDEKTGETTGIIMNCDKEHFEVSIENLKELGAQFLTLSASRPEDDQFVLDYYFRHEGRIVVLRVKLSDKVIPSLYSSFGMSDFVEREVNNLFGIKFIGHPNLERVSGGIEKGDKKS